MCACPVVLLGTGNEVMGVYFVKFYYCRTVIPSFPKFKRFCTHFFLEILYCNLRSFTVEVSGFGGHSIFESIQNANSVKKNMNFYIFSCIRLRSALFNFRFLTFIFEVLNFE